MRTFYLCAELIFAVACRHVHALAIEGFDKLTPAMRDNVVASSASVGPLIEIVSVRTSSNPLWPYELSFKCNCSALFDRHFPEVSWPPPKFEQLSTSQQQIFSLNRKVIIASFYIQQKFNQ